MNAAEDVRCPGCDKLLVRYHRPSKARLDLKCPRCSGTYVIDVEASS